MSFVMRRGLVIMKIIVFILLTTVSCFVSSREFTQTGESMAPTIRHNQSIEVGVLSSFFYSPNRWDVVAIQNPKEFNLLIFRVVGMPNEEIEIKKNGLYVNGNKLELPAKLKNKGVKYLSPYSVIPSDKYKSGKYVTRNEEYFLLGDNSGNANDSRFGLGIVHRDAILNKVEGEF